MDGVCIYADMSDEGSVNGMPSCLLHDEDLIECVGWITNADKLCCLFYEEVEYLTLE